VVHALAGEIALAAGDVAAAGAAFRAGEPVAKMPFVRRSTMGVLSFFGNNLVLRDGYARAQNAGGRLDEAIAEYRRLLTPGRDSKWVAMLEPRHVLGLAQLLDRAGKREAARDQYRRFLQLWDGADPDLPELAEARRALAR
jgi:tetratricopeptide (TPR) repeat protein